LFFAGNNRGVVVRSLIFLNNEDALDLLKRQKFKLEKWIATHPRLWGITISMVLFCLAYWSGFDIGRYLWIAIFLSVFFGGLYFACLVGIKALKNRQ
jgi:hypothetical protein